jgi:hypothetical protein
MFASAKRSLNAVEQTSRSSVSKVISLPAAGRAAVEGFVVEGCSPGYDPG